MFKLSYGEKNGKLVGIDEVEKGLQCECICPSCKEPLIARKGKIKVHHFAHHSGLNCNSETLLHQTGKRLLYERIKQAVVTNRSIKMIWKCLYCHDQHEGDLVKLAKKVKLEMYLGACRPDITILDNDNKPIALIEIVVSHEPDENVLEYAFKNSIPIVEFHLKSANDLVNIFENEVVTPTKNNVCTRPKCNICGKPMYKKFLHILNGECWKCNNDMRIALIREEGCFRGPETFSKEEKAIATEQGVSLVEKYSKFAREKYMANTCKKCGNFIGSFFLHDYYHLITPENGIFIKYTCVGCEI